MTIDIEFDTWKSLAELDAAGEAPSYAGPALEKRWTQLQLLPLRKLDAAALLLLIRQGAGLPYAVPLAMQRLADDPFQQAGEFPADLLVAVLEAGDGFWKKRPALWTEMMGALAAAFEEIEAQRAHDEALDGLLGDNLACALLQFRGIHSE